MKKTLIILFALTCIAAMATAGNSYAHSRVSANGLRRTRSSIYYNRQTINTNSKRLHLYNHAGGSGLVSSEVGHGTSSSSGFSNSSIGGGSSTPVIYGRTGGSALGSSITPAFSGLQSNPVSFATTTRGDSYDSSTDPEEQGYAECPDVDADPVPIGDAILPLLLLISLFAIYKYRKSSI